mmetsp:Transcript_55053/g.124463  ORF Transcript_55053/g.124463 Transcript_55053/m.124463 type:complete len:219 (-) Transcript_55053:1209-1865(-)
MDVGVQKQRRGHRALVPGLLEKGHGLATLSESVLVHLIRHISPRQCEERVAHDHFIVRPPGERYRILTDVQCLGLTSALEESHGGAIQATGALNELEDANLAHQNQEAHLPHGLSRLSQESPSLLGRSHGLRILLLGDVHSSEEVQHARLGLLVAHRITQELVRLSRGLRRLCQLTLRSKGAGNVHQPTGLSSRLRGLHRERLPSLCCLQRLVGLGPH